MKVREAVFLLRKERGWTQARLARELGRGKSTIANWEQGANEPRAGESAQMAKLAKPGGELQKFFFARSGDFVPDQKDNRMQADLHEAETRLAGLVAAIGAAEQRAQAIAQQAVEVNQTVPGVTVHNAPKGIEARMARLEGAVAQIQARLGRIEDSLRAVRGEAPERVKKFPGMPDRHTRFGGGGPA